jgi:hypothetical protein
MPALDSLPERVERLEAAIAEFRVEVRSEFAAVREELKAGDEETHRLMRLLHEDVIERIKILGDQIETRRKPRRR